MRRAIYVVYMCLFQDSSTPNKKIIFDSDSEDDALLPVSPENFVGDSATDSSGESNSDSSEGESSDEADAQSSKSQKPRLFDSEESEDDGKEEVEKQEEAEDQVMFRLRPAFEGEAGKRVCVKTVIFVNFQHRYHCCRQHHYHHCHGLFQNRPFFLCHDYHLSHRSHH